MKRWIVLFAALFACVLQHPRRAYGQQLTVQSADGKQTVLSRAEIGALPEVKITATAHGESATFEGPLLRSVLEKGGVALGETLRGKAMVSCLLVEAADGYRVVIALPELDAGFTDKQVILAVLRNGKPLDEKEGPYRIVIPDEKRPARWVREVTTLKIVEVK